jgi:hypothetical protein
METLIKLLEGTPWAISVAVIGVVWQYVYKILRDKINDKVTAQKQKLENEKFENQGKIEKLRYDYERSKWREQLALQLVQKHIDARLSEYSKLWNLAQRVAKHTVEYSSLNETITRSIALEVEVWRYSKGGLLAEETTREAALEFQTALWEYDKSENAYKRIRKARNLIRLALRADMGLGNDIDGRSIFDITSDRQEVKNQEIKEMSMLMKDLGIKLWIKADNSKEQIDNTENA